MKEIHILDKKFREYLTEKVIQQRIEELAVQMNKDLAGKEVVFLAARVMQRVPSPRRTLVSSY